MREWRHILLAGLISASCAAPQRASPPARAEAAWRRVRTDHFDLTTDLPPQIALGAATRLEHVRAALLAAAWSRLGNARATERARVIALDSEWEFQRHFGRTVDGVFTSIGSPTIVLGGAPARWERKANLTDVFATSTLRHEIVHQIAAAIYGRQPRWFSEGMAQYLETIVISEDGTDAVVGHPNLPALRNYHRVRSIGVADALAWGAPSGSDDESKLDGLYGLSWLMVHWMFNARPDAFAAYQLELARGEDSAWARTFGAQTPDEIDRALHAYALHGDYLVHAVRLEPPGVQPTPIVLDAADVHALRGQLALVGATLDKSRGDLAQESEREIADALALEPGLVLALKLARRPIATAEMLARLRRRTISHPDDGEAWLMMARFLPIDEREPALRKAMALQPGDSSAYNHLAWHLVSVGRSAEALPFATKAALLAPWDAAVLDTYAASLFALKRCADAARIQARAIDHLPPAMSPDGRRSYVDALLRYRAPCEHGSDAGGEPPP